MLTDTLDKARQSLARNKEAQDRAHQTELFERNTQQALRLLGEIKNTLSCAKTTRDMLGFSCEMDEMLLSDLAGVLDNVSGSVQNGYLETTSVNQLRKKATDLLSEQDRQWAQMAQLKVSSLIAMLEHLADFTDHPQQTRTVMEGLKQHVSTMPRDPAAVETYADGLGQGKRIIDQTGANDEILAFIGKVIHRTATLEDINAPILRWLDEHRMLQRMRVSVVPVAR